MEDAFVTNSLSKRIQGGDNQKHQKAKGPPLFGLYPNGLFTFGLFMIGLSTFGLPMMFGLSPFGLF